MEQTTKKTFLTSNLLFFILAYTFIGGSFIMQYLEVSFRWSIIIIQYGIILLPILIVMKYKGINIKEKFRFNKIGFKSIYKVVLITLFALPIAYTLNFILSYILIKLDLFQVQTIDLGSGTSSFLIATLLVAVTPGICEEVFFRGLMFSGYEEKMSPTKAILITGLFFGLFHFNIQNLLLPTFLGIIFAWLVYTTNSIYSSIIAHGLFNFIGVMVMMSTQSEASTESLDSSIALLEEQGLVVIGIFLVVSLISGTLMALFMILLKKDFVHIKEGDTLIIKETSLPVIGVNHEMIHVIKDDEEKSIRKSKLKSLSYKVIKEKVIYEPISRFNYLAVSFVLLLYIGFTILMYI